MNMFSPINNGLKMILSAADNPSVVNKPFDEGRVASYSNPIQPTSMKVSYLARLPKCMPYESLQIRLLSPRERLKRG